MHRTRLHATSTAPVLLFNHLQNYFLPSTQVAPPSALLLCGTFVLCEAASPSRKPTRTTRPHHAAGCVISAAVSVCCVYVHPIYSGYVSYQCTPFGASGCTRRGHTEGRSPTIFFFSFHGGACFNFFIGRRVHSSLSIIEFRVEFTLARTLRAQIFITPDFSIRATFLPCLCPLHHKKTLTSQHTTTPPFPPGDPIAIKPPRLEAPCLLGSPQLVFIVVNFLCVEFDRCMSMKWQTSVRKIRARTHTDTAVPNTRPCHLSHGFSQADFGLEHIYRPF